MPVTYIELDASLREENVTLLLGKDVVLKLLEDEKAKSLLKDPYVQTLLKTKDLSWRDFRESMNRLINLELREIGEPFYSLMGRMQHEIKRKTEIAKRFLDFIGRRVRSLRRLLIQNDRKMLKLEKKLKKINPNLEILRPCIVPYCPKCSGPFFGKNGQIIKSDFKGTKICSICGSSVKREKAKQLRLHEVIPTIRQIWEENLWFEEYTASIVRSLGWQTWTHVHVLGASGTLHEIDVLGIQKGYILICECKTGKVARADVFNFWTKVLDIKSHRSILALTGELPEPETRRFLRKNPVILIENASKLKKVDIVEKIQSGLQLI